MPRDPDLPMGFPKRVLDFAYWRALRGVRRVVTPLRGAKRSRHFEPVDPRIVYPSYKSLDAFVDVERLRALDGYVVERVRRCLAQQPLEPFDTGPLKLNPFGSRNPGSRLIRLTNTEGPSSYFDLETTDVWRPTPEAELFSELMDFVATLPFEKTTRIIVMCDERGREVTMHRDHANTEHLHEFVWFRTNLSKPFYVTDRRRSRRIYVESHTAWFDTVNQFHGADAVDRLTISLRVDGRFTEAFRAQIPRPAFNPASTPSLWASLEVQGPA